MPSNINLRKKNPFKNRNSSLSNNYSDFGDYRTIEDYWKPKDEDDGMLY